MRFATRAGSMVQVATAAAVIGTMLMLVAAAADGATTSGAQVWRHRLGDNSPNQQRGVAVAASPDSSTIYVTGSATDFNVEFFGPVSDFVTVAYDAATGERRWKSVYNGPQASDDVPVGMAVSPDGSKVFVFGRTVGEGGDPDFDIDYATVAYDADTGAQLWARTYNGPADGAETPIGIAISPDGSKVVVSGTSKGSVFTAYATVAYDTATGRQAWVTRSAQSIDRLATGIAVSGDGSRVFVTGSNHADTGGAFETIAYATDTGNKLWTSRSGSPSQDIPSAIGTNRSGTRVFVAGIQLGAGGTDELVTLGYDAANGHRLWVRRCGRCDAAFALTVAGGRVFITGETSDGTDPNNPVDAAITIAYSAASGHRAWTAQFRRPGDSSDIGQALAAAPGGHLYVEITGFNLTHFQDYVTVAYDPADGRSLWARSYDGPTGDGDRPVAIAVTPDGSRVVATGVSSGDGGFPLGIPDIDMATIAYTG